MDHVFNSTAFFLFSCLDYMQQYNSNNYMVSTVHDVTVLHINTECFILSFFNVVKY